MTSLNIYSMTTILRDAGCNSSTTWQSEIDVEMGDELLFITWMRSSHIIICAHFLLCENTNNDILHFALSYQFPRRLCYAPFKTSVVVPQNSLPSQPRAVCSSQLLIQKCRRTTFHPRPVAPRCVDPHPR